jgi:hypothetical protein
MTDPDTEWTAITPGVLELPTTKFRITYHATYGSFRLTWDGGGEQAYGTLQAAKDGAAKRMEDLIAMGLEP